MKHNQVILDAMGGDNAPGEIIKGAVSAAKESPSLEITFVGDTERIKKELKRLDIKGLSFEIVAASQVIAMDESPKKAVEQKDDASINVACRLLANGEGDALVSAGSTGATILSCARHLQRIDGVERGALAAILPAEKNKQDDPGYSVMLDVGATIHCTASQLVQFAIMGIHYVDEVMEIKRPRLALLNIGEEETKGHNALVESYAFMKKIEEAEFIGNIEGNDVLQGVADVIVSEGMIGNIILKAFEGIAELSVKTGKKIWKKSLFAKVGLTLMAPKLKKIKRRLDYSEYGGAPILGFEKLVIKSHGRSKAKAIRNALLNAEASLKHDLVNHIREDIQRYNRIFFQYVRT